MQTMALITPEALATVTRELAVRAQTHGPHILGAQLGKLINDALHPRHVREFGGLRNFVSSALASQVRSIPSEANDLLFEIVPMPPASGQRTNLPLEWMPVAGADLWRYFSNPNLPCAMAAVLPSTVLAGPPDLPLPDQATNIPRVTSAEYRALAEEFLKEHSGKLEIYPVLKEALAVEDFYKPWINALRRLRVTNIDLLKSWEILRAAEVAKALTKALSNAGMEASRVAEIVQLATPVTKAPRIAPVTTAPAAPVDRSHVFLSFKKAMTFYGGGESIPPMADEAAELREFIHRAIDQMSHAELRDIRISAGTLMKLSMMKPRA